MKEDPAIRRKSRWNKEEKAVNWGEAERLLYANPLIRKK
jgi:hypothetical protein